MVTWFSYRVGQARNHSTVFVSVRMYPL